MKTPSRSGAGWAGALRRIAPLAVLAFGVAAGVVGLTAATAEPSEQPTELDVITVTRHILYMSPHGDVWAEEQREQRIVEEFVVNPKVWSRAALPLGFRYNPAGAPPGHDVPRLLQNAIEQWNGVTNDFSFAYLGETTDGSNLCDTQGEFDPAVDLDGKNTIQFVQLANAQALGITCSWTLNSPTIVEFDMRLNPSATIWFSGDQAVPGRYDLASTILHEFGHAAGLAHSSVPGSVMQSSLAAGVMKRTLHSDDESGLKSAYPPIRARIPALAADSGQARGNGGPTSSVTTSVATPTATRTSTPTALPPTLTPTATASPTQGFATPTPTVTFPAGGGAGSCIERRTTSDWELCIRESAFDLFEVEVTVLSDDAVDQSFKVRVYPPDGLWEDSFTKYPSYVGEKFRFDYGFDFFLYGPYPTGLYEIELRVDFLKEASVFYWVD